MKVRNVVCLALLAYSGAAQASAYYNLASFWKGQGAAAPAPVGRLVSIATFGGADSAGMSFTHYQISTTGVNNGDLLLFFGCIDNGGTTLFPNPIAAGFTQLTEDHWGNDGETCVVDWKVAYNEPATYSGVYGPGIISAAATLALVAITGFDPVNPIDTSIASFQTGAGAQPVIGTTAGVTTSVGNELIVYGSGVDWECAGGTTVFTAPTGYTQIVAIGDSGASTWDWTSMQVATGVKSSAGATGSISGTQTGPCNGTAWTTAIAVNPVGIQGGAPGKIAVVSAPQTLAKTWTCSSAVTLELQDSSGVPTASSTGPLTVNLSGDVAYFSDSACTIPITSAQIGQSGARTKIYFEGTGAGTQQLIAASTGLASGTQNETITALDSHTWIGGAGCNGTWATAACWSGSKPTSGQTGHFDSNCTVNCSATLGANATAGSIILHYNAVGSVATGAHTLTLDAANGLQVDAQQFDGTNGVLSITNGNLSMTGGTITLSTGSNSVAGAVSLTGGTLNLNGTFTVQKDYVASGATLNVTGGSTLVIRESACANGEIYNFDPGTVTYSNVTFNDDHGCNAAIQRQFITNGTLNVAGTLTLDSTNIRSFLNGGIIAASGDVRVMDLGYGAETESSPMAPTQIRLVGTNQQLDASGASAPLMPALTIASSGTVTFNGSPRVFADYHYVSGTLDFATHSAGLTFADIGCHSSETWIIDPGTVTYRDITFLDGSSCGGGTVRQVNTGSTMTIGGTLAFNPQNSVTGYLNGGTLDAKGDITIQGNGYQSMYDGVAPAPTVIQMSGTGTQTIDASGTSTGSIPSLVLASTGGPVRFLGAPRVFADYTYTSGAVDFSSAGSTLAFSDGYCHNGQTYTVTPGNVTYGNVSFLDSNNCNGGTTRTLSATMNVGGDLVLGATNAAATLNGGTLSVAGNVTASNKGYTGTTQLTFTGANATTITAASGASMIKGAVTVSKGASTLTLLSNVSFNSTGQTMAVSSGSVLMSGFTLKVKSNLSVASGASIIEGGSCSTTTGTLACTCTAGCGAGTPSGGFAKNNLSCGTGLLSNAGTITCP